MEKSSIEYIDQIEKSLEMNIIHIEKSLGIEYCSYVKIAGNWIYRPNIKKIVGNRMNVFYMEKSFNIDFAEKLCFDFLKNSDWSKYCTALPN